MLPFVSKYPPGAEAKDVFSNQLEVTGNIFAPDHTLRSPLSVSDLFFKLLISKLANPPVLKNPGLNRSPPVLTVERSEGLAMLT